MNKYYKFIVIAVGIFFGLAAILYYFVENREKTVLLAILTQNKPHYLSKYLESIENLDYNKKLITVYIDTTNNDTEIKAILEAWAKKNLGRYKKIISEHFAEPLRTNAIKNKSLQKAKETKSDFYFTLDPQVFLAPYTLKELISKEKPIISPLLHAIPEHNDTFTNFFPDVTEAGYWKDSTDNKSILFRTKVGTFKVPVVHMTYLINTKFIDSLSFGTEHEYDFIAFSRNARNNHVDQYICNEKPFGVLVKFNGDMSLEEEKRKFEIIAPYINCYQEHEKKIIYLKTGDWQGDIYDLKTPFSNKLCWIQLRSALQAAGYDMRQINSYSGLHHYEYLVIFDIFQHEFPEFVQYPKEKLISILWEPPCILTQNYDPYFHNHFSKIYTWRDDLVDNQKYFKIVYPELQPMVENLVNFEDKKLAALVSNNKYFFYNSELYSARRHLVDFYEKNHPDDFDLYGSNWPEHKFYKGVIPGTPQDKIEKLRSYRFYYAYENSRGDPGYITEKIFNCFQAGCVPIYWGASNIAEYIPKECFISREDFNNEEEVYQFIKNIGKEKYQQYIENIKKFLSSDQGSVFSANHFIKTFMGILKEAPQQKKEAPSYKTYNLSNEPLDIVIPSIAKDKETLELCIQGIKENCKNKIGRIIVISPERLTDNAEWFDENKFPFDKNAVAREITPHNEELRQRNYSFNWFYQQLLKMYAPFIIPGISSNVLILDSDTVFLNPVEFIDSSGIALYNPGTEHHLPYFKHGFKLIPGFKRLYPEYSGISHHMLFQRPVLEDMFKVIEETHHMEPWKAFCRCAEIAEGFSGASEYELYFNFLFSRTKQAQIRKLKWENISNLEDIPKLKEKGYHYASAHTWMRK